MTFDLTDVENVQEAIEWAETPIDKELDRDSAGPRGDRVWVLYANVPGQDWFVQLAGYDPTRDRDPFNLRRRRPIHPAWGSVG